MMLHKPIVRQHCHSRDPLEERQMEGAHRNKQSSDSGFGTKRRFGRKGYIQFSPPVLLGFRIPL
ncbi:MAG: hypothetical protein SFY81_06905 [Verrucomicrobiota bacterium]|nr:hypothetical protein [Verrucomicrobiota bacterium]